MVRMLIVGYSFGIRSERRLTDADWQTASDGGEPYAAAGGLRTIDPQADANGAPKRP